MGLCVNKKYYFLKHVNFLSKLVFKRGLLKNTFSYNLFFAIQLDWQHPFENLLGSSDFDEDSTEFLEKPWLITENIDDDDM